MKISMGAWSFSFGPFADQPKPLGAICERLAAAGYDGIELCGYPPHVSLESYPGATERAGLRRLLSANGLGVSGYSADLTSVNPLVEGNAGRYRELFQRLLELCVDVGAPMLRIDTGSAPGSLGDEEYALAFHRLGEIWHACAELAHQAQVFIAWEFEPGFVFNKPSEVVALHDRVGSAWFRVLLDVSHAYLCSVVGSRQHGKREVLEGGVCELIEMLRGRIGAVHLVDTDGTLYCDETSTHRALGSGVIPWRAVAPKLVETCPAVEWWCVDMAFSPEAWDQVEANLAAARRMAAEAEATVR
jgi:sugar phosphate isomerase/epimerase